MNHDETVVRAFAMQWLAHMMRDAERRAVCPDCLLKEIIILASVNVLVKEVASMGSDVVTSDNVESFCITVVEKLEAILDQMDSGEVVVKVFDVTSGEFVDEQTKH